MRYSEKIHVQCLIFRRNGQSISGTARLLQPDLAAWHFGSDHIPIYRTVSNPHTTLLRPKSTMGIEISYMATNFDGVFDDSHICPRMDCCGHTKKAIESTSWHRPGYIRAGVVPILFWMVDVSPGEEEAKIV